MKILVLNGPNLNLLGKREPEVYGSVSLGDIVQKIEKKAAEIGVEVDCFQSNEEGALVTYIQNAPSVYDGIIFNPAGYTHTSVALLDALKAIDVPCVEVHMSNVHAREEFRHKSVTVAACVGQIMGFGDNSYLLALDAIVEYLRRIS